MTFTSAATSNVGRKVVTVPVNVDKQVVVVDV